MIDSAATGVDPARKERLIKVLDIDVNWRMHQVSDGQRRRVQICVGLMRPFKVRSVCALCVWGWFVLVCVGLWRLGFGIEGFEP